MQAARLGGKCKAKTTAKGGLEALNEPWQAKAVKANDSLGPLTYLLHC